LPVISLSPVKILIVLVVALVLLGPDKLPQFSRQIGGAWRELRKWQEKIESGVRENLPDLPSTRDIARMARSPVALLNTLADLPEGKEPLVEDPAMTTMAGPVANPDGVWPTDRTASEDHAGGQGAGGDPLRLFPEATELGRSTPSIPADPSLN
jgi:TatA/E family protein of Tat protein translocase